MAPRRAQSETSSRRKGQRRSPVADAASAADIQPRVFQPTIANHKAAKAARERIMEEYYVKDTECADLPQSDVERQQLVARLFAAMFDLSDTIEQEGSQHHKYISSPTHYSDEVVEANLWYLLKRIEQAQQGECRVPPWYTTEGPGYKAYDSFVERFNDVEDALRQSKSCCCSIFSMDWFPARLAWNPSKELKRKNTNRALNAQKNTVQTLGVELCRQRGIKRGEDGLLRDRDGKVYADGKKEIPTARSRTIDGGVKKRSKPSARARITNKLIAPPKFSGSPVSHSSQAGSSTYSSPNTPSELTRPSNEGQVDSFGHLIDATPSPVAVGPHGLPVQEMYGKLDYRLAQPARSIHDPQAPGGQLHQFPQQTMTGYHQPSFECSLQTVSGGYPGDGSWMQHGHQEQYPEHLNVNQWQGTEGMPGQRPQLHQPQLQQPGLQQPGLQQPGLQYWSLDPDSDRVDGLEPMVPRHGSNGA